MTTYDFIEIDRAIEQGSEKFIDMLEQEGSRTTVYRPGAYPIVYGEISAAGQSVNAPTVLLYGHYDVMPPDPLNE